VPPSVTAPAFSRSMSNHFELTLANQPAEVARLQDQLESFARQHGLALRALHELQLALEEHLTNVLSYAYEDMQEHRIEVRVQLNATELRVEVEDDGRPFNPLERPAPDISKPMEERPVGGLGIHMMRKSVDRLEYRRVAEKNILTMFKQAKAPVP
jgi:anti-sigma regulatory factor (Ser/Thr protein kinase)